MFPRATHMSRSIPYLQLLFFPPISANINTMATGLKSLMYSNPEQTQFPPRIKLKSATQILQNIPLEMMMLEKYGCWCFLSDDPMDVLRGKGMPVDFFDLICRDLVQGYQCVVIDGMESDEPCFPNMVDYVAYDFDTDGDLVKECHEINNDTCAANTCVLEGHFVMQVYKNLELGHTIRNDLIHDTVDLVIKINLSEFRIIFIHLNEKLTVLFYDGWDFFSE